MSLIKPKKHLDIFLKNIFLLNKILKNILCLQSHFKNK